MKSVLLSGAAALVLATPVFAQQDTGDGDIDVIVVEDPEPHGPYGAKGIGEPALVPTAPAIFGAIRHATGVRVSQVPLLPHRLKTELDALKESKS